MENLAPLVKAFLETAEDLKEKIDHVERVIEKQGLEALPPGQVVNKGYCKVEHKDLKDKVCASGAAIKKSVAAKIYATWAVLIFLLGWIGMELRAHSKVLLDITKELF